MCLAMPAEGDSGPLLAPDSHGRRTVIMERDPLHQAWTAWIADPAAGPPPCGWPGWQRCEECAEPGEEPDL